MGLHPWPSPGNRCSNEEKNKQTLDLHHSANMNIPLDPIMLMFTSWIYSMNNKYISSAIFYNKSLNNTFPWGKYCIASRYSKQNICTNMSIYCLLLCEYAFNIWWIQIPITYLLYMNISCEFEFSAIHISLVQSDLFINLVLLKLVTYEWKVT